MKGTILTVIVATLTASPCLRAEDIKQPPINPALLYWQAAALLTPLSDDESRDLRDMAYGEMAYDAAKAAKLVQDGPGLRLMQKAANSTAHCDWGLPMEDGPMISLPHMAKIRQMSSLAILKAESLFAEGKTKDGIDWLLIAHRMARHAGAGDFLVTNLVQFLIEGTVIHEAARHCLGWDEETRHAYATLLKALPPLHTTQDAYRNESLFIDWTEHRLLAGDPEGHAIEELLKTSIGQDQALGKDALVHVPPEKVHEAIAEWRSLQSRTEAALGLPYPRASAEIKPLVEEAMHSPYLLIRGNYPPTVKVADKQYFVATLRTMLEAALEHGPQLDEAVAANYHDAFVGEPLRLQKGKDGTLSMLAAGQHPAGSEVSLQLGK
jgi:hypothetical protein